MHMPPLLHLVPAAHADRQPRMHDRNDECMAILDAFRLVGGLATGDEIAALLRDHHDQPVALVARWVVQRSILSFRWRGQTLVPLFQFDRCGMRPQIAYLAVVRELVDVFDEWEMGLWFTQPNSWLEDVSPLSRLSSDAQGVLRAAQADRFIALG